ncbi:transporter substrate-binding domain-containing protein [Mariprofundus aestuarium]|uniref:transporter substrate-binding domain-containing protein n=1 Tax=Mariprofundus aestuarium TaxID=1921086 RepID=UPI0018E288BF|nr:transporter substrate-binding domain-containing protein [Mariprofundus aestuarium]
MLGRVPGRAFNATLLAFALLFMLLPPHLSFSTEPQKLTQEELQWIEDHPVIRLAPDPTFHPFEFFDDTGSFQGIAADYMKLLEGKLGLRFEPAQLKDWLEVISQIKDSRVDMISAVMKTAERSEFLNFTEPYLKYPYVIVSRQDAQQVVDLHQLKGKKLAVVNKYAIHEFLERDHPELTLVPVADFNEGLRGVSFGKYDAFVANLASLSYFIDKEGITNLRVIGESGYFINLSIVVRKNMPELIPILNKGLAMVSDKERSAIFNKWIKLAEPPRQWWQLSREQLMVLFGMLAAMIMLGVLAWNYQLRKTVAHRTHALDVNIERLNKAESISHLGSWEWNIVTNELHWSDEIYRIFGVPPQEFAATYEGFVKYIHPDDRAKVQQAVDNALANKKPYGVEHRIIRDDGIERTVYEMGEIELDAQGTPLRMLGTVHDLTEQKHLERQLHHSRKMEALGTLIGGIAHDFNNKMGGITGNIYLARKEAAALPRLSERLKTAEALSFEVSAVIKQLITFTQREHIEKEVINLNPCIEEALASYRHEVPARITLHADLPERTFMISGDDLQLQQAIIKIVDNAVDAVADIPHPMIQVSCDLFEADEAFSNSHTDLNGKRFAHLEIKDNGSGIPAENMEHIFEPFFTTKNAIKGQGLGLSVAYGMIQNHHGTVEINSSPGIGTSVHVYLPLLEKA